MTIGEYVRTHGDEELAVLFLHFTITLLAILGVDPSILDADAEFEDMLKYVKTPMTKDIEKIIELYTKKSDILS